MVDEDKNIGDAVVSQMGQREFFCHWLARVYEAGHRDTSYEEGETLDAVLREINQVLGFAGYEPQTKDRAELLAIRPESWIAPDPAIQTPLDALARDFIYAEESQEAYRELKESNSASSPPEFMALADAVLARFGPPLENEDRASALIDPAARDAAWKVIAGETDGEITGEELAREIEKELRPPLSVTVGALIDAWEDLPNDLKGDLTTDHARFVGAMRNLISNVEVHP